LLFHKHFNRIESFVSLFFFSSAISTNATTVTTILASSSHGKTLTFAPIPHRRLISADHFEMLEYPFITLNQLPAGFIQHLGKFHYTLKRVDFMNRTRTLHYN
jgi:hypothetical protein